MFITSLSISVLFSQSHARRKIHFCATASCRRWYRRSRRYVRPHILTEKRMFPTDTRFVVETCTLVDIVNENSLQILKTHLIVRHDIILKIWMQMKKTHISVRNSFSSSKMSPTRASYNKPRGGVRPVAGCASKVSRPKSTPARREQVASPQRLCLCQRSTIRRTRRLPAFQ